MDSYERAVDFACAELRKAADAYMAADPGVSPGPLSDAFRDQLVGFGLRVRLTRAQKRMGLPATDYKQGAGR